MRAILTYHSIDDSGSPISISRAAFARHLEWFASGRVPVVSLPELLTRPGHDAAIALTFDDALRTVDTEALPRLHELGLPATIFVPTGHVGRDNRWGGHTADGIPVLPLMTWDGLGRAAERGITVGAHTRLHSRLTAIRGTDLADEIAGSQEEIRRELGITATQFAYPYGGHDAAVRSATARHYSHAVTTELRPLSPGADLLTLPRLDAWYLQNSRWFDRWGSTALQGFLGVRRLGRTVRAVLT